MIKRKLSLFLLCALTMALCGCETLKGATKGAGEGLQKDWQSAQKIDDWMRKNLW